MGRTIHSTTYNSKQLCTYYYSASKDGKEWRCRKCEQLKSKNGGWTNLLSHLKSCVGKDFTLQYLEHATRVQQQHSSHVGVDGNSAPAATMHSFVLRLSDAEKEMAEWISYLVERNQPISLVDCPATRRLAKLKPVSSKSVRKHILSLMTVVKEHIKHRLLPAKFALVFDGWTEGTDHYIGIWASYNTTDGSDDGKEHPIQTLLSIRPLLADGIEGMTAQDHLCHINRILEGYGKNKTNVICLVGDNCTVNQSIARTMEVPLIGCGSHKFNLAVRRWIEGQPELKAIIAKVNSLVNCNCYDNRTHLCITSCLDRLQL